MEVTGLHTRSHWLTAFNTEIFRRLYGCRLLPSYEDLQIGNAYYKQGFTPKAAATIYLAKTKYGQQKGVRI